MNELSDLEREVLRDEVVNGPKPGICLHGEPKKWPRLRQFFSGLHTYAVGFSGVAALICLLCGFWPGAIFFGVVFWLL